MLKFTIRDLLWLTVVVALGVGSWVERNRIARVHIRLEVERLNSAALWERSNDILIKLDSLGWTVQFSDDQTEIVAISPPQAESPQPSLGQKLP